MKLSPPSFQGIGERDRKRLLEPELRRPRRRRSLSIPQVAFAPPSFCSLCSLHPLPLHVPCPLCGAGGEV